MRSPVVWEQAFVDAPDCAEGRAELLSGEIPREIRGTLLRNGGGRFRLGEDRLGFFDAHGLVAGLSMSDGQAWWRASMVQTAATREEAAAGRMTRRRRFANRPGGVLANALRTDFAAGNTANHDVYVWKGRVIAADDHGHVLLDDRLGTRGPFRLDVTSKGAGCPMPVLDPATNHLIGFSVETAWRADRLAFVEVAPDGASRRTPWVTLGASPAFVHGHAFTERWYAVVELPARMARLPVLLGTRAPIDALTWPADAVATLVLVPRGRPGPALRLPLPDVRAVFHLFDAFDEGDRVILDAAIYDAPPDLGAVVTPERQRPVARAAPSLARLTADPAAGTVSVRRLAGPATEACAVDPRTRGLPRRLLWGSTPAGPEGPLPDFPGYYHGIARFDAEGEPETWSAGPDALVSPPAFVPRRGAPGEGWIMAWIQRSEGTGVVVLDAHRLADGPIAELGLGVALPAVSHARFAAGVLLASPG